MHGGRSSEESHFPTRYSGLATVSHNYSNRLSSLPVQIIGQFNTDSDNEYWNIAVLASESQCKRQ